MPWRFNPVFTADQSPTWLPIVSDNNIRGADCHNAYHTASAMRRSITTRISHASSAMNRSALSSSTRRTATGRPIFASNL